MKLVEIRVEAGFSQKALAKRAGVAPSTIFGIEIGRYRTRPETMAKISRTLGVRVNEVDEFEPLVRDLLGVV